MTTVDPCSMEWAKRNTCPTLVATFCLLSAGCAAAYAALIWSRPMLAMSRPSKSQPMPMMLFSTQSVANVPPRPARIIQALMVVAFRLQFRCVYDSIVGLVGVHRLVVQCFAVTAFMLLASASFISNSTPYASPTACSSFISTRSFSATSQFVCSVPPADSRPAPAGTHHRSHCP